MQRWRAFQNEVQRLGVTVEDGDEITFLLPMPGSWSKQKQLSHLGAPHRAKPDLDNLIGGLFDAAMPDGDQHISELGTCRKVWGDQGVIVITRKNLPDIP